jgi:hypothetical protein
MHLLQPEIKRKLMTFVSSLTATCRDNQSCRGLSYLAAATPDKLVEKKKIAPEARAKAIEILSSMIAQTLATSTQPQNEVADE